MSDTLLKVDELVEKSLNIPEELKKYISAICKGYIKKSNGMISLKGVENICRTKFVKVLENDKNFATENNFLGETDTQVLSNGDVCHVMSYVNASDKIKLIMILTHELGHVVTEYKVNKVLEDGSFPFMKRTSTYYVNSYYKNDILMTNSANGFRLSDGFLETICSYIFMDDEFREEIRVSGCDLGDYYYKDKRLFSSRIYDEFRDCFQLFDEILGGKLFEFACMRKDKDEELIRFINSHKLHIIYSYIDKALESLWSLKKYEHCVRDEDFDILSSNYFENKRQLLMVADILAEDSKNQDRINDLKLAYADMSKFENTFPFYEEELNYFNKVNSSYNK